MSEKRKKFDPCPECGRKIYLDIIRERPDVKWTMQNLPLPPKGASTVTIPIETLKRWRNDYNMLSEFSAWVCGVDQKRFCVANIMTACGAWAEIGAKFREVNGVEE